MLLSLLIGSLFRSIVTKIAIYSNLLEEDDKKFLSLGNDLIETIGAFCYQGKYTKDNKLGEFPNIENLKANSKNGI